MDSQGILHRLTKFIRATVQKGKQRLGCYDLLLLGICILLGLIMTRRTSGLLFEKDDLRYVWWAYSHQFQPWDAFTEPALFSDYYRPVVLLVWWFHWILFGASAFGHQLAFSLWWLAIFVLAYAWGRKQDGPAAGFFPCLVLLSATPIQDVLVWKSWLTVICEIVFFLSALLSLRGLLADPSKKKVFFTFLLFLAACLSKESGLLSLPLAYATLILMSKEASFKKKGILLAVTFLLAGIVFTLTPTLKRFMYHGGTELFNVAYVFDSISYYSTVVWSSSFLKTIGVITITLHLYWGGKKSLPGSVIVLAGAVTAYYAARHYGVSHTDAFSLGLIVYLHGLWLSPYRNRLAVPLVWFMVTFWALPAITLRAVAYAMDTGVAFSVLLGTAIFWTVRRVSEPAGGFVCFWRRSVPVAAVLVACMLLPCSIYVSMRGFFRWAGYVDHVFHNRARIVMGKVIEDLMAFKSWPDVYVQLGERISLETSLVLTLLDNEVLAVHRTDPPANSYRLEAYTGANYHVLPEDDPFNVWLSEAVGPPPLESFRDPYFMPERWHSAILTTCDTIDGWLPPEKYTHIDFPLGQGFGHVNHQLQAPRETVNLTFRSAQTPEFLKHAQDFALTFWLRTDRWDMIDTISVRLSHGNERVTWDAVSPKVVNTFYDWRRAVVHKQEAARIEPPEQPFEGIEFRLTVQTRDVPLGYGAVLGIDEIRIAIPK